MGRDVDPDALSMGVSSAGDRISADYIGLLLLPAGGLTVTDEDGDIRSGGVHAARHRGSGSHYSSTAGRESEAQDPL